MFGSSKQGFTLIEILVAIAILAVMAAIIAPNLAPQQPAQERKAFIAQLNELMQLAWQNALITNTLHRVKFDFKKEMVTLEQATGKKDATGEDGFAPLERTHLATTLSWPEHLQIKNFFIEGFDEMTRFAGRKAGEAWFYVVPDGMAQRVTINLVDMDDLQADGKAAQVGLVLNPFNAQFKTYDTFKK